VPTFNGLDGCTNSAQYTSFARWRPEEKGILKGLREATASGLVNEIRNRFPRRRAFQAELSAAVRSMARGVR